MLFYFRNMINDVQYISIKEILSRVTRHPLLQDVNLEAAIQYTIDFIGVFGLPDMYEDKEATVQIENYRGTLPCDLIAVNQVKDTCTELCLRSMTDTFMPSKPLNNCKLHYGEFTYKTRNKVIFTSFENGEVLINYKSIPVDEDGFPLIIDNSPYLRALESFIKKEVFTMMFENGELPLQVLQNTQQDYAWRAGQLQSEFNTPNDAEMESICRMWTSMIQNTTSFDRGFKHLGDRQYLIRH